MSGTQGSCWNWQSGEGFEGRKNCQQPDLKLACAEGQAGRKLSRILGSVGQHSSTRVVFGQPLNPAIPHLAAHRSLIGAKLAPNWI